MKFDINYHYRMAVDFQRVMPVRMIYLQSALRAATIKKAFENDVQSNNIYLMHQPFYQAWVQEVNVKEYRRCLAARS